MQTVNVARSRMTSLLILGQDGRYRKYLSLNMQINRLLRRLSAKGAIT